MMHQTLRRRKKICSQQIHKTVARKEREKERKRVRHVVEEEIEKNEANVLDKNSFTNSTICSVE